MANVHDLEEDSLDKYEHGPEVTNDHNDDKLSEQLELEMAQGEFTVYTPICMEFFVQYRLPTHSTTYKLKQSCRL